MTEEQDTTQSTTPEPLVCMNCGTAKSCGCAAPYVSVTERAMEVIKRNPGKADHALAKETGISARTFARARDRIEAQKNKSGSARADSKKSNGISVFRQQLNPVSQNVAGNGGIDLSAHHNTRNLKMVTQPPQPFPVAFDRAKKAINGLAKEYIRTFREDYGDDAVKDLRQWLNSHRW